MASSAAEEQAYIDGTHPALAGNAAAMGEMRSASPTRSVSPTSSDDESPRFTAVDPDPPTSLPPPPNPPARNGGASNTGPKGVLADWKARNQAGASNTGPKGVLADFRGSQAAAASSAMASLSLSTGLRPLEGEVESDEEGEAGAIEAYRAKRLAELSGSGERRPGRGKKVFGHLREIGMEQFLGAVDEEDAEVAVVLHLYEADIAACLVLNHHLASIARAYPHTKFIRALATEMEFAADAEDDTLPTLLVYRAGELETTLVRMDRDWGAGSRQEILNMLLRNNAVSGASAIPLNTTGGRSKYTDSDSGDDDE